MNNKEDFERILSEELKRKTRQRKDYEQDIIRLKTEVTKLLEIENYLISLRESVITGDFSEKGDKLILNCKYKKY